jgi:hypothetical protein
VEVSLILKFLDQLQKSFGVWIFEDAIDKTNMTNALSSPNPLPKKRRGEKTTTDLVLFLISSAFLSYPLFSSSSVVHLWS